MYIENKSTQLIKLMDKIQIAIIFHSSSNVEIPIDDLIRFWLGLKSNDLFTEDFYSKIIMIPNEKLYQVSIHKIDYNDDLIKNCDCYVYLNCDSIKIPNEESYTCLLETRTAEKCNDSVFDKYYATKLDVNLTDIFNQILSKIILKKKSSETVSMNCRISYLMDDYRTSQSYFDEKYVSLLDNKSNTNRRYHGFPKYQRDDKNMFCCNIL